MTFLWISGQYFKLDPEGATITPEIADELVEKVMEVITHWTIHRFSEGGLNSVPVTARDMSIFVESENFNRFGGSLV